MSEPVVALTHMFVVSRSHPSHLSLASGPPRVSELGVRLTRVGFGELDVESEGVLGHLLGQDAGLGAQGADDVEIGVLFSHFLHILRMERRNHPSDFVNHGFILFSLTGGVPGSERPGWRESTQERGSEFLSNPILIPRSKPIRPPPSATHQINQHYTQPDSPPSASQSS